MNNRAIRKSALNAAGLAVLNGSGNVYRDLGQDNADVEQFKALLAAEIIKTLDRERLSVRQAHARIGIAAADFSRIRKPILGASRSICPTRSKRSSLSWRNVI